MKKTKNDQSSKKPHTMLDQEIGSMEDIRTHEDFNNQHPNELEDTSLKEGNSDGVDKKVKINIKPTVEKKIVNTKIKKRK